ncbi:MAG TPA: hypothetical protein PKX60_06780 [Prolixibacteraceae bacterium]|nr:hypothetical protein [Prolixibacteraceae bacterium]
MDFLFLVVLRSFLTRFFHFIRILFFILPSSTKRCRELRTLTGFVGSCANPTASLDQSAL